MMNRVWIPVLLLSLVSFRRAEGELCKCYGDMRKNVPFRVSSLISNKQNAQGA